MWRAKGPRRAGLSPRPGRSPLTRSKSMAPGLANRRCTFKARRLADRPTASHRARDFATVVIFSGCRPGAAFVSARTPSSGGEAPTAGSGAAPSQGGDADRRPRFTWPTHVEYRSKIRLDVGSRRSRTAYVSIRSAAVHELRPMPPCAGSELHAALHRDGAVLGKETVQCRQAVRGHRRLRQCQQR
jgi:hypothetical protein